MTNYQKGARLERKIVNRARQEGKIAFRSAGSHSPIDVCIIDPKERIIELIQCKKGRLSKKAKNEIIDAFVVFSGHYMVTARLEHSE